MASFGFHGELKKPRQVYQNNTIKTDLIIKNDEDTERKVGVFVYSETTWEALATLNYQDGKNQFQYHMSCEKNIDRETPCQRCQREHPNDYGQCFGVCGGWSSW